MIALASMSRRDRRALVVGAVTLLAVGAGRAVLPRIRAWEKASVTAAEESKRRAAALRRIVARRDSRRLETAAMKDSTVLIARDPGSAAAKLIAVVRELTDVEGMALHAIQPRIDSTRSHAAFLASARTTVTADVQGLAELLISIEGGSLLLRVSEISVLQSDVFDSNDRPDVLKVDLTVQGVVLIRAGAE